mmetsp:Transcript_21641/g.24891  ORF Transcript_21641/g.24891 Transcript_21641/m.24891 type:complete len:95 (-) Transcript_21641:699-983(-)
MTDIKKKLDFYVRKTQAIDNWNYYTFTDPKEYTFYSVGELITDISAYQKNELMLIRFLMDNKYHVLERKVFTFEDLIGKSVESTRSCSWSGRLL